MGFVWLFVLFKQTVLKKNAQKRGKLKYTVAQ